MESFEKVLTQFAPSIGRIAASYEANEHIREELIQDIGLAVWRALPNQKGESTLKAYVMRIAHNKCVDHVAKEAIRNKPTSSDFDSLADGKTTESDVLLTQQQKILFSAVRKLRLPLRQVITLVLEDLSYQEIAQVLDIEVSNVGARVNRAKQQLRELMQV